jgi:3-oxoacyl-[acyl-carrier-protein] synthase II
VPHTARNMDIDVVLSNSFGFGGTNGSLVFRRFAD